MIIWEVKCNKEMKPNDVKVSVIIPLYNQKDFIEEALNSVINQTWSVDEIIVINDGSTDGGENVVKQYKNVKLLNQPNSGKPIITVNNGLKIATGNIIAFLDGDDYWEKNKTEIQLQLLLKNPHIDVVFGNCIRITTKEEGKGEIDKLPGVARGGGLFKRTAFNKVPYFNGDASAHCFMDWFARAKNYGINYLMHPEVVYFRRIHGDNYTINQKQALLQQYFSLLKAKLERERANKK
jgi:glycosyltransferase involved in cell wall biosynthesis